MPRLQVGIETSCAEVRPLVAAGLRHVVMWNVGPLGAGGSPADLARRTQLIWKLKKLATRVAA